ncbi:hypothetical protein KF707_11045 [Candidatus Obscuribacterales bacterium]|nr:hypothetical protein [Candidatus Obscuribacterales bacterium]
MRIGKLAMESDRLLVKTMDEQAHSSSSSPDDNPEEPPQGRLPVISIHTATVNSQAFCLKFEQSAFFNAVNSSKTVSSGIGGIRRS